MSNFGGTHITNVHNQTVVSNTTINRVAFNGGTGGRTLRPTAQQVAFAHEQHVAATSAQVQHGRMAASNPQLRDSFNHGHPAIAATARPAEFTGRGVVAATGAEAHPANAAESPAGAPGAEARPGTSPALPHEATAPAVRGPGTEARPGVATQGAPAAHAAVPEVQHPTATNEARPAVTLQHPAVEAQHPAVEAQHPAVETPHPTAEAARPAVPAEHAPAPVAHAAAPAVRAPAPAVHSPAPAYHAAAPAARPAAPAVHTAAAAPRLAPAPRPVAAPHPAPQKKEP